MTDLRYAPAYPASGRRSPVYNPARLSVPTIPPAPTSGGQYSLYSGPIPHIAPAPHPHQHHQPQYDVPGRRQTNPPSAATYQAGHNPVARSSSLRQPGSTTSNVGRRSSTMDSNTARPVIVTTNGSGRPHGAPNPGRNGERSPTRDPFRSSDEQYWSQPASSIRPRSVHRPTYSATLDNDELARLRERGDLRHAEPYRPRGSGGPVYSSSHKDHKHTAVPDEGYEYYRPADLVRFDLENPQQREKAAPSRRRESLDRGSYYRPSVLVNSGYDRSRPPPTTRGLDKINRPSVPYDGPSARTPILTTGPTPPMRPPADTNVLSSPTRRERPSSMYNDSRTYHHKDTTYYPSREEERHHNERRDVDREKDRRYDAGDGFHDGSVTSRGFGIRTDDQFDPSTSYRRPVSEYIKMPPEPRRRSDESVGAYDEREREDRTRRERLGAHELREQLKSTTREEDGGFSQKVAARVGAAASSSAAAGGLADKEVRDEVLRRGRSPDDDRRRDRMQDSGSDSRSRSRSHSRAYDKSNSPVRVNPRDRDPPRDRYDTRYELKEEDNKQRNRREAEDRLNGTSPRSSSGQLTPTSDDERNATEMGKRRNRRSSGPNDPAYILAIRPRPEELVQKIYGHDGDSRVASPSPEKRVTVVSHDNLLSSEENRGRELVPVGDKDKQVRVVSPPRGEKLESKPLRGILKQPSEKFPEELNPIREGVAPHKDDKTKKDAPVGARWTKIRRDIVNPEALLAGKERFEVRDNFVIVLRVLNKEEIEQYAYATQLLREKRHTEKVRKERPESEHDRGYSKDRDYEKERTRGRDDDRDRHHHKPHRREDEDEERRYREVKEHDRERRVKHRHDSDVVDPYADGQRALEYHGHGSVYHRKA